MDREAEIRAEMKKGLQKIQANTKAMAELARSATERLEKAEAFIRKLGYCPECEKRLPRRGFHDPKACRHKPRED